MRTVTFTTSEQQGQFDARQRYEPSPPDGTYVLLRVTPGAEPTVTPMWWCGRSGRTVSEHEYARCRDDGYPSVDNCGPVVLVRGVEPQ